MHIEVELKYFVENVNKITNIILFVIMKLILIKSIMINFKIAVKKINDKTINYYKLQF
jgi:hypothetical protein